MRRWLVLAGLLAVVALVACGGASSGSSPAPTATVATYRSERWGFQFNYDPRLYLPQEINVSNPAVSSMMSDRGIVFAMSLARIDEAAQSADLAGVSGFTIMLNDSASMTNLPQEQGDHPRRDLEIRALAPMSVYAQGNGLKRVGYSTWLVGDSKKVMVRLRDTAMEVPRIRCLSTVSRPQAMFEIQYVCPLSEESARQPELESVLRSFSFTP